MFKAKLLSFSSIFSQTC